MNDWTPTSWQARPAAQQATYPSEEALNRMVAQLSNLPPLVTSWEVEALKSQLAEAAEGRRFVLQGGDCAENFDDCSSPIITNKLKILLQMSLLLVHGLRKPVTRVGRIAGQFAKPRSADLETRDGVTLPSYRGDLVNGPDFTEADRTPDPVRLMRGYGRAAMTLNFIRALVDCGFADLHHPENWNLEFVKHSPLADDYQRVVDSLGGSLRFMETLAGSRVDALGRVQFFTSHEGLHLHYEQAQTRQVPHRTGWYNLSTHLPWIGLRTADVDGAHVEYFRGISNPIGVKVGSGMSTEWVQALVEILNPDDEPGRLILIHRYGAGKIADGLPGLIEAVRATGKRVLWMCDPMHGNTETTSNGYKTRRFENILSELEQSFDIHAELGSHLGGVHFELTGDDVTECVGGARGLGEADLVRAYRTQVDPRLNYEQALEMAMRIVRKMGPGGN
ncbi:class II 3-deoxy-7-phosphoheptulonate synthase [Thioalbus denitrificans]|uniref:Phospho-2-dehydro-3-deoxyheptonate aldolase n=1 Tax=Thioalbus denitrificans TaxID=547122 RepID=A0A369BT42_9GAMM|nr:3-deoxy-7-phosphoheptulonate synthase class II [Thioalbus denitrificans]RCX24809.1 3-deoxy-D-arabinoheptulosonate-7-phosphate synthase [Thioalbus denitrificans]